MPIIGGILSLISSVAGGIFGMKRAQGEAVQAAIGTLGEVSTSDMEQAQAAATAITAVYMNGNFIERSWRPLFMYVVIVLIVARWFGYCPPELTASEVDHLYNFMYIGLVGYMPLRSLDKWMMGFQIGGLLKSYMQKKIL